MSQGLTFNIDVVFCIDVAMSPTASLDWVKAYVISFVSDLIKRMAHSGRVTSQARGRIVIFDSCHTDVSSIRESPFYKLLPAELTGEFSDLVTDLVAGNPGEIDPLVGQEALSAAINSDWVEDGDRQRHIIVMFVGDSLDTSGEHDESNLLKTKSPQRISSGHLNERWEQGLGNTLHPHAKRLVLLAPDVSPWTEIGDTWSNTVFLPRRFGDVPSSGELEVILDVCIRAV